MPGTGSTASGGRLAFIVGLMFIARSAEAGDGLLHTARGVRFPIGSYEMPADDSALEAMAESGFNLVRCRDASDLDRCRAAGLMGWLPLPVQEGPTEALRARVLSARDHPALAVWEGPDEVVWNFTAFSGLARTAGFTREDWHNQTPKAVAYARREADRILPRMNAAIGLVRSLDPAGRPFWINEAAESDVAYVRRYMDSIDVTGCDLYPVKAAGADLASIGRTTDRWRLTGRGKPVWMVLQAFSWHKVRPETYPDEAYPSFDQTRFMAWDAIAHGARGVIYWGSETVDRPDFRASILAMAAELAKLEPFLVAPDVPGPETRMIEATPDSYSRRGVRVTARRSGDDWLVVLVNEDATRHLGVEVVGLDALEGRELHLLYGDESERVDRGGWTTRMQGYETKVYATSRSWESPRRDGRDFSAKKSEGPRR